MTISCADFIQLLDAQTTYKKERQQLTLEVLSTTEYDFEVTVRIRMPRDQAQFIPMRHALTNYTGKGINYGG